MGRINFIRRQSSSGYNPLTTAWIAATGESDLTILGGLNTFEQGLIDNSLTSKFTAIYPMVGGTALKHSYNFINTATFQLTFFGSWTHTANGALVNAANAYATTGIIPSTHLSLNDNHLSSYIGTISNSGSEIGAFSTVPTRVLELDTRTTGGLFRYFGNDGTTLQVATADNRGWSLGTRTASTTKTIYKNGVSVGTNSVASTGLPTVGLYLGTRNVNGTPDTSSQARHQFDSIGLGFTSGETSTLYTLIQALQTTLSRQF